VARLTSGLTCGRNGDPVKAILSHPFSGALYWWMDNQNPYSPGSREKKPQHPYYRTLYGDVDRHLDTAIACAVVYEEIVLPPADAHMPGVVSDPSYRKHTIPELEISTDWDLMRQARDTIEPHINDLERDSEITRILRTVPTGAWRQVIIDAANDAAMSRELGLSVICSPGRRALMARLVDLGVAPGPTSGDAGEALTTQLSDYVNVIGLRFNSTTVESLAKVKWQEDIRSYASVFQEVMAGEGSTLESLYETIGIAWLNSETATQVAGSFSAVSRVMNFAGLVPGVGTVTGVLGIAADGAAALAQRRVEAHRWYELGPTIQKVESLQRLEARIQELRR
jgi:hypothetical protein